MIDSAAPRNSQGRRTHPPPPRRRPLRSEDRRVNPHRRTGYPVRRPTGNKTASHQGGRCGLRDRHASTIALVIAKFASRRAALSASRSQATTPPLPANSPPKKSPNSPAWLLNTPPKSALCARQAHPRYSPCIDRSAGPYGNACGGKGSLWQSNCEYWNKKRTKRQDGKQRAASSLKSTEQAATRHIQNQRRPPRRERRVKAQIGPATSRSVPSSTCE